MTTLYDGFHKIKEVEMPSGDKRESIVLLDAVSVLLIDREDKIALVKQYRAPIGKEVLEIPAGVLDKDLSPEETLREEIMEECNLSKEEVEKIELFPMTEKPIYSMIGSSDTTMHIYIGLYDGVGERSKVDNDDVIEVVWVSYHDLVKENYQLVAHDMKSLTALLLTEIKGV